MNTKKVAYWLGGSMVSFLVLTELASRFILGLGNPVLSVKHPTIEYMFVPDQEVRRFGNRIYINNYGMRSDSFEPQKDSNELRIMIFGDSVINGGNLIDQDDLALTKLSHELSRLFEKKIIVGNISANSWGPGNWLAFADEFGFFDADIIGIVLSSHDVNDIRKFLPLNPNTHPTQKPLLASVELISRYLSRYLPRITRSQGGSRQDVDFEGDNLNIHSQEALPELRLFLEMAQKQTSSIVIFQHWTRSEIGKDVYPSGYKAIKDICEELDIQCVSLKPYFQSALEKGESLYRDDIHLTRNGQHLLYEALFDFFRETVPLDRDH